MTPTIGILIFDGVGELDYVGPWEVLCSAAYERPGTRVLLIAERDGPVTCQNGMRVMPDITTADAPRLDVILVPGGQGTRREATNKKLLDWIARVSATATWTTSVCTGSLLLVQAGLCDGRRITTNWDFIPALREIGRAEVLDGPRYVRDGQLVTATGVSAGIDMTLWLVGQIWDPAYARRVQKMIQYDPAPPYEAEV